jgi:hypothetical protein
LHGSYDKTIDKTAVIIDPIWKNKIKTSVKIRSHSLSVVLKPRQYLMFIGNNIVTVLLTQSEYMTYDLTCVGKNAFLVDTNTAILKDEQQNYFFVRLL